MAKGKMALLEKREKEEEAKRKYGVKETKPNVKVLTGRNEDKMKKITGDKNFGSTVKNAFVKGAEAQANNQTVLAKNIANNVQSVLRNYGGANAAYGDAYTRQAEMTGNAAKQTVNHWVSANAANSEAHSRQAEEKIRGQIADGGIDVLGHALAARGLSGGKTLDSYNKFLEYSATGQISDDKTVTPGAYTKIVDETVADYLTKQYGTKAGNIYNKATGAFDQIASFATLGPEISLIKGSMDLAGDTLNKRLANGASDKEAAEAGFMRGAINAAGELGGGEILKRTNPIEMSETAKNFLSKMGIKDVKSAAGQINDRKNDFIAGGIISVGNLAIDTFEDERRVFDDTVASFRKKGFDQKQARKNAISELLKRGGSQALYDSVMSVAEQQFYDALQRR